VRLLVLDQSKLLPWIVQHDLAAEPGLEVEAVACLHEAEEIVRRRPPDAAVVSLPPAHLDWREFQHLCAVAEPPVPVLYESCVHAGARDAGLEPIEGFALFLPKPAPSVELHQALLRLVAEARRLHGGERPSSGVPLAAH